MSNGSQGHLPPYILLVGSNKYNVEVLRSGALVIFFVWVLFQWDEHRRSKPHQIEPEVMFVGWRRENDSGDFSHILLTTDWILKQTNTMTWCDQHFGISIPQAGWWMIFQWVETFCLKHVVPHAETQEALRKSRFQPGVTSLSLAASSIC